MGGLSNGTQYYVINLTNGNYQLASSLDNALAGSCHHAGSGGIFRLSVVYGQHR